MLSGALVLEHIVMMSDFLARRQRQIKDRSSNGQQRQQEHQELSAATLLACSSPLTLFTFYPCSVIFESMFGVFPPSSLVPLPSALLPPGCFTTPLMFMYFPTISVR